MVQTRRFPILTSEQVQDLDERLRESMREPGYRIEVIPGSRARVTALYEAWESKSHELWFSYAKGEIDDKHYLSKLETEVFPLLKEAKDLVQLSHALWEFGQGNA